jgi:asparaginyl-tRNA synthetase
LTDEYVTIEKILAGGMDLREVKIRGWLHGKRSGGGIQFLLIRDGSGIIQCTAKKDQIPDGLFKELEELPRESTLEVFGVVRRDTRSPRGFEITLQDAKIFHKSADEFPIAMKKHGSEFLLDHRHLWIRSQKMQMIMRARAEMLDAARTWLKSNDYTEVQMPTLITAACEGGSTLFEVKYFDERAYLTQSWQLYAEAVISSLGNIYTVAPSFRAEKSRTRRHLTEYWHLEVEAPWIDLDGIMNVQEGLVSAMCHQLSQKAEHELQSLGRNPEYLRNMHPPFPRLTYDKAIDMLREDGLDVEWGIDFGYREERKLALRFEKPFFITHFPKGVKAFYHMPDPSKPEVTLSADLLAPEGYGEITGGGQRIHDLGQLLKRVEEEGLDPEAYKWYIDLRRYGTVPHSGFGMGVERTLSWMCKLKHIRDAIPFPRLINRIYP